MFPAITRSRYEIGDGRETPMEFVTKVILLKTRVAPGITFMNRSADGANQRFMRDGWSRQNWQMHCSRNDSGRRSELKGLGTGAY